MIAWRRTATSVEEVFHPEPSPNIRAKLEGPAQTKARSCPIITSLEPGEDWSWCYVDQLAMELV